MNPISPAQLLEALNWRYATKHFDATKKIPAGVWEALERALILTPTSHGLQPYRFVVVTDLEKRGELIAHSWNQKQVTHCSHFVVFAACIKLNEADVDRWIQQVSDIRKIPVASLNGYRGSMLRDVVHGSRAKIAHEWATRQAYIALGNLMTSAAILGVDACPMEGIVPAEFDRLLNLIESGYATVMACALGYRAETDKYASLPKTRFDAAQLIKKI